MRQQTTRVMIAVFLLAVAAAIGVTVFTTRAPAPAPAALTADNAPMPAAPTATTTTTAESSTMAMAPAATANIASATPEQCATMFQALDTNQDGRVTAAAAANDATAALVFEQPRVRDKGYLTQEDYLAACTRASTSVSG
jgi:hypothetical protein